ncbi:MAG: hypothetical protein U9R00_02735 [Patescibacteria group bacterium]|nr:hypothetical protein [Patescibacteria group bacterium]
MYSEERTKTVHCMDCWNSDERDPSVLSKDYDFSRSFFEQFKVFREKAPILFAHHTGTLVRSDFTNYSADNKDCYLSYSVIGSENIIYSENSDKCKNSIDCYSIQKTENCYYNIDCDSNYNSHYCIQSQKCMDSLFIYDCINCQNCCLSTNLRNKQYIFKNKQLSKEKYEEEVLKLKLNTYSGLVKTKNFFDNLLKTKAIHRFAQIHNSQNATGDYIGNSKDIFESFVVQGAENIHYSYRVLTGSKDSYDSQGLALGELMYESVATSFSTANDYFTYICIGSKECEYSLLCKNCSNCFACIGLNNSKYCIFNKQYDKNEYFVMIDKIKKHMNDIPYIDSKGRVYKYGEFFPYEMSPFGYNETNANEYFPISKEEAISKGYPWKEKEDKNYKVTINSGDLPDDIDEVSESIFGEIISCPNNGKQEYQCSKAYKIIPEELQFLKQKGLPLPRYCPNCRHYERLSYRNHFKTYHRKCMKQGCQNKFETSYSPDRPEIVYCEKCYQQEVY